MRRQICFSALITLIAGGLFAYAGESTPTTTGPATAAIHGQVHLATGLDVGQADLSHAVVFFDANPALDALSTAPKSATVAQKNKAFVPSFAVISKGATVEFPNWDHISHNVFSRSAAAPAFDLDRYPYGQSKSRVFDRVGVVQVFCNIHPFMRAIIFVTPNQFFARADAEGRFEIKDIPPGKYQLSAWQDRCAIQHQTVEVGSGNSSPISFTLREDHDQIIANDPSRHSQKYGVERGLGLKREHLNLPVVTESHPAPTTEPCDLCN